MKIKIIKKHLNLIKNDKTNKNEYTSTQINQRRKLNKNILTQAANQDSRLTVRSA